VVCRRILFLGKLFLCSLLKSLTARSDTDGGAILGMFLRRCPVRHFHLHGPQSYQHAMAGVEASDTKVCYAG
jgi:hypothetical protein